MVDLGITQYLSGNICWFMFSALCGRRHGTPLAWRAVCAHIMNMADIAAREGGLDRLHLKLTVRKIRAQNKPKLALKAAHGRHFLPILLKVLQLFFPAGSPRERVMDVRADDATSARVTREELGGPRFLASMTNADILISSGSLESRPHDIKALAERGVLQYWWTEHKVRRTGDLVSCQPTLQCVTPFVFLGCWLHQSY